jgi:hypothetical protein
VANAAVATRSSPPVASNTIRGGEGLQPFHERDDAIGIVRHGPTRAGGTHGHISLGFGDIKPNNTGYVNHRNSCRPALAETGSTAPHNGTGLRSPGRDAPRSAPVSTD